MLLFTGDGCQRSMLLVASFTFARKFAEKSKIHDNRSRPCLISELKHKNSTTDIYGSTKTPASSASRIVCKRHFYICK